jgi:hypothetical protein
MRLVHPLLALDRDHPATVAPAPIVNLRRAVYMMKYQFYGFLTVNYEPGTVNRIFYLLSIHLDLATVGAGFCFS